MGPNYPLSGSDRVVAPIDIPGGANSTDRAFIGSKFSEKIAGYGGLHLSCSTLHEPADRHNDPSKLCVVGVDEDGPLYRTDRDSLEA